MANPLFGIVAAARLDITVGSSSRAAYLSLAAQYQFGTPVIHHRAPQELAASIGVPFYSAVGDPGVNSTTPGVVVVSFPNPVPSVVVSGTAYPVSTNVAGGTLVGVNYVDPNGVLHPDVDWEWQISVDAYQEVPAGSWDQQVIGYTGNGIDDTLIATTFPLNTGKVAIWIFPEANAISTFRTNVMPGSGYSRDNTDPLRGIMSFTAAGFTIKDGIPFGVSVNAAGIKYTAIVIRDSTIDNRYMQCFDYNGMPAVGPQLNTFVGFSNIVIGTVDVENIGTPITVSDGLGVMTIVNRIDGTHYIVSVVSTSPTDVNHTVTYNVIGRNGLPTGMGRPNHLWIFGKFSNAGFYTEEMPAGLALDLSNTEIHDNMNLITAVGIGNISVGSDQVTNGTPHHYYGVAFTIPVGSAIRNVFATYSAAGSGGAVVIALPFTPGFAMTCEFNAGVAQHLLWKSFQLPGTTSTQFNGPQQGVNGITALGAGSVTIGPLSAPAGKTVYGFALGAAASVPAFAFAPAGAQPFVPSAGLIPDIVGIGGGQVCSISTTLTPPA